MTLQPTKSFDTGGQPGSTDRDLLVQYNTLVKFLANRTYQNPGFQISTNFDIQNANAISVAISGVISTLAATQVFDTGTAATITATKWGIAILTWDGTTRRVRWLRTTSAMGFASEADAKAALGTEGCAMPADGEAILGYVTVQAGAALWTAGTDALQGGVGGTVATTTTYYNDPTLNGKIGQQVGNMAGSAITA